MLQAYFRADGVYKTGVIQPFPIERVSPVDAARGIAPRFIRDVRGEGPAIAPYPANPDVAAGMTPRASGLMGFFGRARARRALRGLRDGANITAQTQAAVNQAIAPPSVQSTAGARPVIATPPPVGPMVASPAASNVFNRSYRQNRLFSAYRAMLQREKAWASGSVWDATRANARVMRVSSGSLPRVY